MNFLRRVLNLANVFAHMNMGRTPMSMNQTAYPVARMSKAEAKSFYAKRKARNRMAGKSRNINHHNAKYGKR